MSNAYYDRMEGNVTETMEVLTVALRDFPYFVLRDEMTDLSFSDYKKEVMKTKNRYLQYRWGVMFSPDGTHGDYVASDIRFKESKTLIDKQARFMFSRTPDVVVQSKDTDEKAKKQVSQYQKLIDMVLKDSKFPGRLLASAKDCLIGSRIAILVDFSDVDGIQVHFYNSLQFYYELDAGTNRIVKFITFEQINRGESSSVRRYLVNRYHDADGVISMSSALYDGTGRKINDLIEEKNIDLQYIPAYVVVNTGLLSDTGGVSDMADLAKYESGYSKIANSDIDSERRTMNPIRYTVDMNPDTTENLPTGPGAYWDLQSNQNMESPHPSVGAIAPSMGHTEAVKTTLDRIKTGMYQSVDVPNISEETMVGSVTSGKALKALYWPLMVRCDEKLKEWIPALQSMAEAIIDYAKLEKQFVVEHYVLESMDEIQIDISIRQHYALLDDETEEKASDMSEIAQNARSRRSYLKKWRKEEFQTDEQIQEELMQIAVELNMFDTMSMNAQVQTELNKQQTGQNVDSNLEEVDTENKLGE